MPTIYQDFREAKRFAIRENSTLGTAKEVLQPSGPRLRGLTRFLPTTRKSKRNASVQLTRHHDCSQARRIAHPWCRAVGYRRNQVTFPGCVASIPSARSGIGKDAIHRDRYCLAPAGSTDRHIQAAHDPAREISLRYEGQRFSLDASQSGIRRARHFCLCRRRGLNWEFPGELFWPSGHCGTIA